MGCPVGTCDRDSSGNCWWFSSADKRQYDDSYHCMINYPDRETDSAAYNTWVQKALANGGNVMPGDRTRCRGFFIDEQYSCRDPDADGGMRKPYISVKSTDVSNTC